MDEKSCEIFNIFSLLRKLNGLNKQRVEAFGLNNIESIILFHIDKIENLTQKDLVNILNMPKQTVNSIIMNLKDNDLIYMKSIDSDKRVKKLVLTDKGAEEVANINRSLSFSNSKIYDQLGAKTIRSIEEDLNQIIKVIEENMNEEVI
ncbi:MarR family winged helix-turn-helix transcriptional regulator [Anaerococcus cruorum]|uniref:MarR family winged helix-turn-helix transcriptional regulator n=1 Tax=Anaerococcus sp. WGS1596 TaxID=3366806 RepID=UPI00372D5946